MAHKILIIDDDLSDRRLMIESFLNTGLELDIREATDGKTGLEEIKKSDERTIIVLDTMLPDADGFAICKQAKELFSGKIKVIICTGVIDAVDARKARLAGADDYCVKTSDFKALTNVIQNFLR